MVTFHLIEKMVISVVQLTSEYGTGEKPHSLKFVDSTISCDNNNENMMSALRGEDVSLTAALLDSEDLSSLGGKLKERLGGQESDGEDVTLGKKGVLVKQRYEGKINCMSRHSTKTTVANL